MVPRFLVAITVLLILLGFTYTGVRHPSVSPSPQELTVKSRTRGNEILKADVLGDDVRIRLQNKHAQTITAFAISLGNTTVKVDFAYSEVSSGIEPGETLEKSYSFSHSAIRAENPTLHLLTVLLRDGTTDGDLKVAQEIYDQRLGQKIQLQRMLKVLEKGKFSRKDIKALTGEINAALEAGEDEARIIRKELVPASAIDDDFSEALRKGLHWGREKMKKRLQDLEHLPTQYQEEGFLELKGWAHKLYAKL